MESPSKPSSTLPAAGEALAVAQTADACLAKRFTSMHETVGQCCSCSYFLQEEVLMHTFYQIIAELIKYKSEKMLMGHSV